MGIHQIERWQQELREAGWMQVAPLTWQDETGVRITGGTPEAHMELVRRKRAAAATEQAARDGKGD